MDQAPAEAVLEQADRHRVDVDGLIRPVAEWFHAREGNLSPRKEAHDTLVSDLADNDAIPEDDPDRLHDPAGAVIGEIVGDGIDPVTQVENPDGRYVGVIAFTERAFYYEFVDYHHQPHPGDGLPAGRVRKAVCGACVHEAAHERDVFAPRYPPDEYDADAVRRLMVVHHAARHAGLSPNEVVENYSSATVEEVYEAQGVDPDAEGASPGLDLEVVAEFIDADAYIADHDFDETVTGATLVSSTATTSGDDFWHQGNVTGGANIAISANETVAVSPQGSGSGLDADTVDGSDASQLGGVGAGSFSRQSGSTFGNLVYGGSRGSYSLNLNPSLNSSGFVCNLQFLEYWSYMGTVFFEYSYSGGYATSATLVIYPSGANVDFNATIACMGITVT